MESKSKLVSESEFEPKILAFLCNWCSYAGADLAGVGRNQYPPNIRVIRVMCSGRVDPRFILDALIRGIDGVLILGCHLGDCHYSDGNFEAKVKYEMLQEILKLVDIDQRINLNWVSAAEGLYFANIVTEFTEKIRLLGPNPLTGKADTKELEEKLHAIKDVVSSPRVRKLVGRERELTTVGNVYNQKEDLAKFKALLKDVLRSEFLRSRIHLQIQKQPSSVKDLAVKLKTDSSNILEHIVELRAKGMIDLSHIQNVTPYYISI
jgi:coenzyme F420-reducing hydrogenase delta subunit